VPSGAGWVHEIKHDGYRLQVRREGDAVRMFTRRGTIGAAAIQRSPSPPPCCAPGRLRSTAKPWSAVLMASPSSTRCTGAATVTEAMLYAFDLLELDGEDLRWLPLGDRKKCLARLLGGRRLGIVLSDHAEEDGATIYRQACVMGLEGIVSKRLSAPYRSGPSRDWLKVKNPNSPAMIRAREAEW
jgi:bifunctional non-homologous end joining protein LigD